MKENLRKSGDSLRAIQTHVAPFSAGIIPKSPDSVFRQAKNNVLVR